MAVFSFRSPAKVNLFLSIEGRRKDGYHSLNSLFQTLSLSDTLAISPAASDQLTANRADLPCDSSNLICQALSLMRERASFPPVHIHLEKNIPMQAGLGGGSSNAATTLFALNHIFNLQISEAELRQIGAYLGSDVPFFFSSGTALCQGRGDEVRSLTPLEEQKLWVVKPSFGLSTPAVYRALKVDDLPKRDVTKALQDWQTGSLALFNDLERPALELAPSLSRLKAHLEAQGASCQLSGSGSAFFYFSPHRLSLTPELQSAKQFQTSFLNRKALWY
ncbi:MAG: ispE [Chlamydiales bacterium]|jgi:4-diphosphocytidyl-2-C-methyl-D-erythritol kinase|nr:ispE [Chlamydiales bacterium]